MKLKTLAVFVLALLAVLIADGSGLCQFFEAGSMAQVITDPPPSGSVLTFEKVSNSYPSNDRDPADTKPMIAKEENNEVLSEKPTGELPGSVCPLMHDRSLFRAHARYAREQSFRRLDVRDGNAIVYHSNSEWGRIVRAGGGILLLSTSKDPVSEKWIARVSFSKEYLCGDGIFEVEVDDWLTPDIPVLAIEKSVIVISANGRLAYMQVEDTPALQWRTVWDTDISIEYQQDKPTSSAPAPAPANNAKPAPRKNIQNRPQFKGNR